MWTRSGRGRYLGHATLRGKLAFREEILDAFSLCWSNEIVSKPRSAVGRPAWRHAGQEYFQSPARNSEVHDASAVRRLKKSRQVTAISGVNSLFNKSSAKIKKGTKVFHHPEIADDLEQPCSGF
jgi:hypothetical protein